MIKKWENDYDKYLSYLESDKWTELRNKRLEMDGYRCSVCKNPNNLQVHHLKYPAILGTESLSDLMTLCQNCHKKIDDIRKSAIYSPYTKQWTEEALFWICFKTEEEFRDLQPEIKEYLDSESGDIEVFYYVASTRSTYRKIHYTTTDKVLHFTEKFPTLPNKIVSNKERVK